MQLETTDQTVPTERRATPNAAPALDDGASHRIRTLLIERLSDMRRSRGLTQVQAARWFGVSQPRISHLTQNRTNRFTADTLINMLAHAGIRVSLTFEAQLNDGIGAERGAVRPAAAFERLLARRRAVR